MPSMSVVEQVFCRSAAWGFVARRGILPWALRGSNLYGDVLELGAGAGTMAIETVRRFPNLRLTATDIDPAMLAAAKQRIPEGSQVSVQLADVTALPFADQSFDYVVSYLMLHHVIDWEGAVAEVARVLRPGARFIGYDLTKSRAADWVHRADRSPYRLIGVGDFVSGLDEAGFGGVDVATSLGGHVMRFRAHKVLRPQAV